MDKEMMAKVEEFVKEYGKRELSMEDLDQVVGGTIQGIYDISGNYHTTKEIINLASSMEETFGFDIAGEMICTMFKLNPDEAKRLKSGSDSSKMAQLLNELFWIYERTSNGGNSY